MLRGGRIKKVSPTGGPAQTIAEVPGFRDADWGAGGDIIFIFRISNRTALLRVYEAGRSPRPLTTLDESRTENSHRGPVFLPDGRRFLFSIRCSERENNALYMGSLDAPTVTRLMPVQSTVTYLASRQKGPGALLYSSCATERPGKFTVLLNWPLASGPS